MSTMAARGGDTWHGRFSRKLMKIVKAVKEEATKAGREDPRKVVHSIKVGMALTIASLIYLLEPFFNGMGQNSIWTVLTVILVLEFTAGATLYKGINRGLGTLLAISFAFLVEIFARHFGHSGRAICIGISVFLIGSFTTYVRFIPSIKKHYDQGLIIFLVTFNLVMLGSYHDNNALHSAIERIYTVAIGGGICLVASLLILPNWSGEDLQSSIISKFEELAKLVQECVDEYFQQLDTKETSKSCNNSPPCNHYEEALNCNSVEESLAPQQVRALFREPCKHVAEEVVKVLNELAGTIKTHHQFSPHISDHLHEALEQLDASIKSQPLLFLTSNLTRGPDPLKSMELTRGTEQLKPVDQQLLKDMKNGEKTMVNRTMSKAVITWLEFSVALPLAAFVSLLVEVVARLDVVIEQVEELGKIAHFEEIIDDDKKEEIKIVVESERKVDSDETVGEDSKDSVEVEVKVAENKK
ncbi:hypothetical protein LguiA_019368 [Lonicera macranthoides]